MLHPTSERTTEGGRLVGENPRVPQRVNGGETRTTPSFLKAVKVDVILFFFPLLQPIQDLQVLS